MSTLFQQSKRQVRASVSSNKNKTHFQKVSNYSNFGSIKNKKNKDLKQKSNYLVLFFGKVVGTLQIPLTLGLISYSLFSVLAASFGTTTVAKAQSIHQIKINYNQNITKN